MESRDEALIARYLAQEASADEIREVETRRENDKMFSQLLADSELAFQALRLHQREALRDRFRKRDEVLDKNADEKQPPNRNTPWLLVFGFLGLGLLIWMLMPGLRPAESAAPSLSQDPDSTSQHKEVSRDTISEQTRQSDQIQPFDKKIPQKETTPIAPNAQQGENLFAAYFSPYVDDMMDPAVRGDSELSTADKFQLAYWEKRYADAVREFPRLNETMSRNDNLRFMYANALMAKDQVTRAIPILESIVQNNRSRYVTESLYVLALGYCKTGDLKKGRSYLEQYLERDAIRKADALKIVQELK